MRNCVHYQQHKLEVVVKKKEPKNGRYWEGGNDNNMITINDNIADDDADYVGGGYSCHRQAKISRTGFLFYFIFFLYLFPLCCQHLLRLDGWLKDVIMLGFICRFYNKSS